MSRFIKLSALVLILVASRPGLVVAVASASLQDRCCPNMSPSPQSDTVSVQVDPARSIINFKVRSVLHTVHGRFQLTPSVIDIDNSHGSATGTIDVNAASSNTGNATINRRITKLLSAGRYPTVSFTPTHFRGSIGSAAPSQVEVTGVMRLDGNDHLIRLAMAVQMNRGAFSASGWLIVPYVAWGLPNPSTFIFRMSKEVEIDFYLVGQVHAITARDFRASVTGKR